MHSIRAFGYTSNPGQVGTLVDELEFEYHVLDKLKINSDDTIVLNGTLTDCQNFIYTLKLNGSLSVVDNLSTGEYAFTYFDIKNNSVFYGDYYDDSVYKADIDSNGIAILNDCAVGSVGTVSCISVMDSGFIGALGLSSPPVVYIIDNPSDGYIDLNVVFNPQYPGVYDDQIRVETDSPGSLHYIPVYGESPEITLIDDYDLLLDHDMRWDQISYYWFNTMGYVQEVKDANAHIPLSVKMQKYVPIWTRVIKPDIGQESIFVTSSNEWRATVD